MTNAEKAEQFSELLGQVPSVLTVCVSKDCTLADHLRAEYPDMITLEWGLDMPQPIYDLAVTELGISGTMAFGTYAECVFVPWDAIVNVRVPGSKPEPPTARPRLTVIKGGRGSS